MGGGQGIRRGGQVIRKKKLDKDMLFEQFA